MKIIPEYLNFKTPKNGYYFFGYYDKSPLDYDDENLLAMRAKFMDRMPDKDDTLDIGYFKWRESSGFIKIEETRAWNWQQGCMLQWIGPEFKKRIIYNDRIGNKFISILFDIETKEKTILPMAIYSVHPKGEFALCIDNERHFWFRGGYNYQGVENTSKNITLDENDGIWLLDIREKKAKQIINIMDIIKSNPLSNMKGATHYLEHLMFSPDGERFCFLHRWKIDDGGIYARFYTANMDGSDIFLLNDTGRMSHFCWRNAKEILAFCGLSTPINRLRKYNNIIKYFIKPFLSLYHKLIQDRKNLRKIITGDGYVLFQDKTGNRKSIAPANLSEDGHMSFCPVNINWFVSDTYQNESNYRKLFLFNIEQNIIVNVADLRSDPQHDNYPERCDLHPKWSYSGKYVCIDTVNEGLRQMYVYDMEEIVQSNQ